MHIREMKAYDLHDASAIDPQWSIEAWSPYIHYEAVDGVCYSARVLEHCGRVVGCMAYRWTSEAFYLHRVAVASLVQRQDHGTRLVVWLQDWLQPLRQNRIESHVDEYDLQAALFLKSCGFKCVRMSNGFYVMEFALSEPDTSFRAVNRISKVRA